MNTIDSSATLDRQSLDERSVASPTALPTAGSESLDVFHPALESGSSDVVPHVPGADTMMQVRGFLPCS